MTERPKLSHDPYEAMGQLLAAVATIDKKIDDNHRELEERVNTLETIEAERSKSARFWRWMAGLAVSASLSSGGWLIARVEKITQHEEQLARLNVDLASLQIEVRGGRAEVAAALTGLTAEGREHVTLLRTIEQRLNRIEERIERRNP